MNALPVGPQQVADSDSLACYFDDLERWGFDIAYSAYRAFDYADVIGEFRDAYTAFTREARRRGFPSCIQIQSTVCAGDKIGIEEAQYDAANNPERRGEKEFFASFSSDAWRQYLEDLTTLFVQEYGFDYVVFEEPIYRVDIPGSKDRFHAKFAAANPAVRYPDERRESAEYLLVQQAKTEALLGFCGDLAAHAKAVGAKKVGIMPWFFIPTIENASPDTLNPSCDIARIAQLPDNDFLVVRMQPDNIIAKTMRTGDDISDSPLLYYVEVAAHAVGKEIIAVSNPTDEHADHPKLPLIPFDFYRDCTLSAFAAAPCGFTRHWYGQNHGKDDKHMEVLSEAARYATRFGEPKSPVAFVFSYSGTRHAQPFTYETVFPYYWALARHMASEAKVPMLTFYADTLEQSLRDHPEVQVLVLEEHFPLSVEQMMAISRWWQVPEKRSVVAFGSGTGFNADVSFPGRQPCGRSFPGVFELIGLRQEDDPVYEADKPIALRDTARIKRCAFLGDDLSAHSAYVANVRRVFGSRAVVLYEADMDEPKLPVVAEWRDRSSLALFCGFGLSPDTVSSAAKAISYVLKEVDAPTALIDSCSDGILWSTNKNDYVVISNLSDKSGRAVGHPGRANFWDCLEHKLVAEADPVLEIGPKSFRVLRLVRRRSKFLDIIGVSHLRHLIDGAGRAEIEIIAGRQTTFVLRASPNEILVDGRACPITQEVINGIYHVTLQQCPPGERRISLRW